MTLSEYETWARSLPSKAHRRVPGKPGLGVVVQADGSLRWTLASSKTQRAKQAQKNLDARSWQEALAEYTVKRGQEAAGEVIIPRGDKNVTDAIEGFMAQFETKVKLGRRSPKTLARYENDVRLHLVPRLRGMRLRDLSSKWLERFSVEMMGVYSENTVDNMFKPLRLAMKYSIRERWLVGANPFDGVDQDCMPTQTRRKARLLSNEELDLLFLELTPIYYNAILLLALTGLRLGELCGLKWRDVHVEKEYLMVVSQLDRDEDGVWRQDPHGPKGRVTAKENLSIRPVGLLPAAVEAIERQRKLEEEKGFGQPDDWFATTSLYHGVAAGTPLAPWNARRRGLQAAAERAGLGHIKPHDLRHTTASILAAHNIPKIEAARWMGHSEEVYAKDYARSFDDIASRQRTLETLTKGGYGVGLRLVEDVA